MPKPVNPGRIACADQFLWDTSSSDDPEAFGRVLCADQGLPLEFVSLIGASIREQVWPWHTTERIIAYNRTQHCIQPNATWHTTERNIAYKHTTICQCGGVGALLPRPSGPRAVGMVHSARASARASACIGMKSRR